MKRLLVHRLVVGSQWPVLLTNLDNWSLNESLWKSGVTALLASESDILDGIAWSIAD